MQNPETELEPQRKDGLVEVQAGMMKRILLIGIMAVLAGCGGTSFVPNPAQAQAQIRPILVVGTFPDETAFLESQMVVERELSIQNRRVLEGILGGKSVVLAVVGVGSVNSSSGVSLLIERYQPTAVLLNGVAGGLEEALPGDVVIGTRLLHYGFAQLTDDGYSPWPTYQPDYVTKNPLYFTPDQGLLRLAREAGQQLQLPPITIEGQTRIPKVIEGSISSEDVFSEVLQRNQEIARDYGVNTFEEEGAPVAQTCYQLGIPFLVIRGISNRAEEDGFETFEQLSLVAAEAANRLVLEIIESL